MARANRKTRAEEPEHDEDTDFEMPEGNFVVLIGYERFVNAYLNKGEPVDKGDVLNVGHAMYHRLSGLEYLHPKSDEMRPVFRDATKQEIMVWMDERSGDTPDTMRESDLIRAAREEQVASGDANPDTEEQQLRAKRLEETRDPLAAPARRRRSRSAGASED